MKTTSKLKRMMKVLSMAFMIFLQIYWYKISRKKDAEWEILWDKIGKRFRKTLFELEGLLIKIGQILSIRADLLPEAFIRQIQDLTDQVPPSEWKEIEKILETQLEGPIDKFFHSIEKKAVASASIGEVYKGVLKDGQKVAIKVQRPNIESIVQTDFRTLKIIITIADRFVPIPKGFINFKVLFNELKLVIERELDFEQEKNALLSFKERYKNSEIVKIPEVYAKLCTSKVMVMEWVDGIKITDDRAIDELKISKQDIAKRLIETFLPQWLEPGTFHADPHSGNVLISSEGKIILLDFGMTSFISKKDAKYFQELIQSLLSKNFRKAVEALTHLGFLLPEADPRTMERLLAELMAFEISDLKEMDLVALKLELSDVILALPIQVPTRFVFLGRSFITIEGIIRSLASDEELIDLCKPVFLGWLDKQGNKKWAFVWYWLQSNPLFKVFHSANEFLKLPDKLETIKETEQKRVFQFTIYENYKKQAFYVGLLGVIGIGIAIYSAHSLLLQFSSGILVLSSIGYITFSIKLKKWLKYMHEKRKD